MKTLEIGNRVYAKDGKLLGTVAEFRDDKFKLDAALAVDFWLNGDEIENVQHGSVLMAFDHSDLPAHRIEAGAV